jgi:hypothetical protein
MATAAETPFSELINKPKDTVAKLKQTPDGRLRLRRRDDEDLVLATASRVEQDAVAESVATRIFVALMQTDPDFRALVTRVIPEVFPWVRFLPAQDVREFAVELVETLRATDDLNTKAPVAQVITAWRHTAEIHADPELSSAIAAEHPGDGGPVPSPGADE